MPVARDEYRNADIPVSAGTTSYGYTFNAAHDEHVVVTYDGPDAAPVLFSRVGPGVVPGPQQYRVERSTNNDGGQVVLNGALNTGTITIERQTPYTTDATLVDADGELDPEAVSGTVDRLQRQVQQLRGMLSAVLARTPAPGEGQVATLRGLSDTPSYYNPGAVVISTDSGYILGHIRGLVAEGSEFQLDITGLKSIEGFEGNAGRPLVIGEDETTVEAGSFPEGTGDGVTSFDALSDTPAGAENSAVFGTTAAGAKIWMTVAQLKTLLGYTLYDFVTAGAPGDLVTVNAQGDPAFAPPANPGRFLGLIDTPADFGNPGDLPVVNQTRDGLIFASSLIDANTILPFLTGGTNVELTVRDGRIVIDAAGGGAGTPVAALMGWVGWSALAVPTDLEIAAGTALVDGSAVIPATAADAYLWLLLSEAPTSVSIADVAVLSEFTAGAARTAGDRSGTMYATSTTWQSDTGGQTITIR